eukprot:tig00020830_g14407.t1
MDIDTHTSRAGARSQLQTSAFAPNMYRFFTSSIASAADFAGTPGFYDYFSEHLAKQSSLRGNADSVTQLGLDFFWLAFGFHAAAAAAFAHLTLFHGKEWRRLHVLTLAIAATGAAAYYALARGQGAVALANDAGTGFRLFCWARYVQWAATAPALVYVLGLLAGAAPGAILAGAAAAEASVAGRLFGALSGGASRWGWFACACAAQLALFALLFAAFRPAAYRRSLSRGHATTVALFFTLAAWLPELAAWVVGEGRRAATADAEVLLYAVLDVHRQLLSCAIVLLSEPVRGPLRSPRFGDDSGSDFEASPVPQAGGLYAELFGAVLSTAQLNSKGRTRDMGAKPAAAVSTSLGKDLSAYAVLANILRNAKHGLGPWSLVDVTLGIFILARKGKQLPERLEGAPVVTDRQYLTSVQFFWMLAGGCYRDFRYLHDYCPVRFVSSNWESEFREPAYCIAVNEASRQVILAIRGTELAHDVLTDLDFEPVPFGLQGGLAHGGMLESARYMRRTLGPELGRLLAENQGFGLAICGHSVRIPSSSSSLDQLIVSARRALTRRGPGCGKLGAGVAALLTVLYRDEGIPAVCYAFATPACVARNLSESVAPYISSFVLADDLVPRLSAAHIEDLRRDIARSPWQTLLTEEVRARTPAPFEFVAPSTFS